MFGGTEMKLKGKIAVVTGGGRGIGRSIAMTFAREGADLVIASDCDEEIRNVAREIEGLGRRVLPMVVDVSKPNDVYAFAEKTKEVMGGIDILVNNAGVVGKRFFVFLSDDDIWRRTVEVNLFGVYYCTKAFLPMIIERKQGRIISMASISGKQASPTNSAYAASKHGVIGITRTVAAEMGLMGLPGITVNAICPGVANTDMIHGPGGVIDELAGLLQISRDAVLDEKIKPMSIQKRLIDPEEIADMALYLASDAGRGITGQAINVCGGSVFY